MDIQFVINVFAQVGLIARDATLTRLDDRMRNFCLWVTRCRNILELAEIKSASEQDPMKALQLLAEWERESLAQVAATGLDETVTDQFEEIQAHHVKQDAVADDPLVLGESGSVVRINRDTNIEEATKQWEGVAEGSSFPNDLLYTYKVPNSHELVPQSFFGMTIFTIQPGTSLEKIDRKNFKHIYDSLRNRLEKPELIGVTLDPVFDGRLFRTIIKRLKGLTSESFEIRKNGHVVQDGTLYSVPYLELFKEAGYSESAIKAEDFTSRIHVACKRISQFKMGYVVYEDGEEKHKFDPFFGHLELNATTREVEFIGTSILYEIFRDDKILNLHSSALSLADGKIENTLLLYIVSLPRKFDMFRRDKPLDVPIPITTLIIRCYPDIPHLQLLTDNGKLRLVREAMLRLREKGLLEFEIVGRGKKTVYHNVVHYCELNEKEFGARFGGHKSKKSTKITTLKDYLVLNPFPRHTGEIGRLEFANKHIPRAFTFIDTSSNDAIVLSFKGVYKPRIQAIAKYAALIDHRKMLSATEQILELRA